MAGDVRPQLETESSTSPWYGSSVPALHRVKRRYGALAIVLSVVVAAYYSTYLSVVETWFRSDTYLHGIVVVPISLLLIWSKRDQIKYLAVSPCWAGLAALAALSLTWWLCFSVGIQAGAHFAAVALLPTVILTVLGRTFTRAIAFPLAYLIFAVPMGDILIPWLIDFTALFTVEAINLTGIPVIREDRFFSTSSGDFEVARACSGIRYLLASLALGTLYAYLSYRSYRKRLAFIGFSFLFPIIANGIRAYTIVLIAHYSDLQLAVGIDHIIFGWIFFGLVVFVMFMVGNRFRDVEQPADEKRKPSNTGSHGRSFLSARQGALIAVLGSLAVLPGPTLALRSQGVIDEGTSAGVAIPARLPTWSGPTKTGSDWFPAYINPDTTNAGRFEKGDNKVDLVVLQYRGSSQNYELANSENQIVGDDDWLVGAERDIEVGLGPDVLRIKAVTARRNGMTRAIWYWYDVNGRRAVNQVSVKLLEALSVLQGGQTVSTLVAVSVSHTGEPEAAASTLTQFLNDAILAVDGCLSRSSSSVLCRYSPAEAGAE